MNSQKVKIGDVEIELNASVWTLLEYKRIFNRDWFSDRNAQFNEAIKAIELDKQYGKLTDAEFAKLPQEKQDKYWQALKDIKIDTDFTIDTIYAMAVSGGYTGTQKDMFEKMSPKDLDANSEFMKIVSELIAEFTPEPKKKV